MTTGNTEAKQVFAELKNTGDSKLHHVETKEKDCKSEAFLQEKTFQAIGDFDKGQLKHADTAEKNPLPDREALEGEKKEVEHRKSINSFDKKSLRRSQTIEKNPLPEPEVIAQEKTLQQVGQFDKSQLKHAPTATPDPTLAYSTEKTLEKVEQFDKSGLKHTDTHEMSAQLGYCQDKTLENIGKFDKSQLKHADTAEKNPLPDKAAIAQEKTEKALQDNITGFKRNSLKHTETAEKSHLPSKEDIAQEKAGK